MSVTPDAIRELLDELEANRRSRRTAWATLQQLRKFLEASGARIPVPNDRTFETEGEAIESGLRRTLEGRDMVMRGLIRAVYRFRDATLVDEKKDDFGNARLRLGRITAGLVFYLNDDPAKEPISASVFFQGFTVDKLHHVKVIATALTEMKYGSYVLMTG
jgi:hypothetical protein